MLFYAHSGLRYLVFLAGVLAVVYAVFGVVAKRPYDDRMGLLAGAYAAVLDLQIILGFFLVVTGRFTLPGMIGHIFLGLFAAAVAHVTSAGVKRKPPEERSYLPHVVGVLVSLVLVAGSITALGRPLLGGP